MDNRQQLLSRLVRTLADLKSIIADLGDTSDMSKEENALIELLRGMADYSSEKISEYISKKSN